MSDNRMWLEHVDTGERVLLAKFFGGHWVPWRGLEDSLDVAFEHDAARGHVYRDGPKTTENTYRIVYEHGDAP